MIFPTPKLVKGIALWGVGLLVFEILGFGIELWVPSILALVLVSLLDALPLLKSPSIEVERDSALTMPLGERGKVKLIVRHWGKRSIEFLLTDHHPVEHEVEGLPLRQTLGPEEEGNFTYFLTPSKRGESHFGKIQLALFSPWGFFERRLDFPAEQKLRTYPNYASAMRYGTLASSHRLGRIGIHLARKRGDGNEFHQLREFREGDSMNRIDWRATAKTRKIIAKDFQQEKDQQVIFVLDLGRNMGTKDGRWSHLECVLNAIILQGYVALFQGDAIGLLTYAGQNRWMPPSRKKSSLQQLLNNLFDLEGTKRPADHLAMTEEFHLRVKKRSLVILFTGLQVEEKDDLLRAHRLLSRQHLVLIVALQERVLGQLEDELNELEDSPLKKAYGGYMEQRRLVKASLQKAGATIVECPADKLSTELVNTYLDIKAKQIL